jgi:hypothetical protein
MPVITVLGKLNQEERKFQTSLGYMVSLKPAQAIRMKATMLRK